MRKLLGSLAVLVLAWLIVGQVPVGAQGSEKLWTSVREDPVNRLTDRSATLFTIDGADSDTSEYFSPWKWTGFVMSVFSSGNSPNVQAQAWCGNKIGDNYITVKCDSLAITSSGHKVWQLNIPIATRLNVIFSSGSTANGTTTIDSVMINRNW